MGSLMLPEGRAIQPATGMPPGKWEDAINEGDAEAITALIWVARKRNGEPNLRFEEVDGDLATFRQYLHDDPVEDETEEAGKHKEGPIPAGLSSEAESMPSASITPEDSGSTSE